MQAVNWCTAAFGTFDWVLSPSYFLLSQRYCHDVDGVGIQFKPFIFIRFSIACVSLSAAQLEMIFKSMQYENNFRQNGMDKKQQSRKSSHAALIKVNSMNRNRKIMKEFTMATVWTNGTESEREEDASRFIQLLGEINFSSRATAHKSQWKRLSIEAIYGKQVTFSTPAAMAKHLPLAFRSRCFLLFSVFLLKRENEEKNATQMNVKRYKLFISEWK